MGKRILLASKFYYTRGGAEIVVMNMATDLALRGYDVGVFAMDYPLNVSTKNFYTVPNVGFDGNIIAKLKFAARTFGLYKIKSSFRKALADFSPDIVHLHNIHSHISPIITKMAKQAGCKVVWTMHDYKLVCPAYNCLNNGSPCELCLDKKSSIIKRRCMKGNFSASMLAYLEARRWNRKWIERYVDSFVCPSGFLAKQMLKGGFGNDKIKVACNFIDSTRLDELSKSQVPDRDDYYVYVGRFSPEKGVGTLLEAAKGLPYNLKLAGAGPLLEEYKATYSKHENIEFLGQLTPKEVCKLLARAKASVIPSQWYENNPLSIIESLCAGTPVIGADIGGIPELITHENGVTFTSGNVEELGCAITKVMQSQDYDYQMIAKTSQEKFSFNDHLEKLEAIYNEQ